MISSKFKGKRAAFSAISMCATMAFSAGTMASSSEVSDLQSQLDALSAKLDQVSNIKTKGGGGLGFADASGTKTFKMGGRFQVLKYSHAVCVPMYRGKPMPGITSYCWISLKTRARSPWPVCATRVLPVVQRLS